MKKLALLAAMVFAFAVGANAMSPDDKDRGYEEV